MGLFDFFKKKDSGNERVDVEKYDSTPDEPRPIGYKASWLAIKNVTPEQVIAQLGVKNAQTANWESGMKAADNDKLFITPVMDGYVIIAGVDYLTEKQEKVTELAKGFEEVLFFGTHRVVELNVWAKYVKGEMLRWYYFLGESGEVISEGELTPEELKLGFDSLISSEEDDWETVDFPDEESVMAISKAWGVDPWFEGHQGEVSTGYVALPV